MYKSKIVNNNSKREKEIERKKREIVCRIACIQIQKKFVTSVTPEYTRLVWSCVARFLPVLLLTVSSCPRGPIHHVFTEESGDSRNHKYQRGHTSLRAERSGKYIFAKISLGSTLTI